jgi:diguanylate cyclase (GGDEF)-like protein
MGRGPIGPYRPQVRAGTIQRMTEMWVDPLTELPSWVAWDEALAIESARRSRYRRPVVIMRVALDGLARVATDHGDEARDEVLVAAAGLLRQHLRAADILARIDHDEFAVLMTETEASVVEAIASRLREASAAWRGSTEGVGMSFVIGWAAPEPFGELREAMRMARDRMEVSRQR